MLQGEKAQCMAASVFGSMQQVAGSMISPMWAIPLALSVNVSSIFGVGLGVPVFTRPGYSRKFWLLAGAELIVYGATKPDATVTIGGYSIRFNSDGIFRFQMS